MLPAQRPSIGDGHGSDLRLADGVKVLLALQDKAVALPPSAAAAQIRQAYEGAVTRVLSGKQSAQQALAQAQAEAEKAIQQAGG